MKDMNNMVKGLGFYYDESSLDLSVANRNAPTKLIHI